MPDPQNPGDQTPDQPAPTPTEPPQVPAAPPAPPAAPVPPTVPADAQPTTQLYPPTAPQVPLPPQAPQQPYQQQAPQAPQAPQYPQAPGAAQPPAPPYPPQQPGATQPKGLAISALIVGIVSLVFCWVPFIGILGGIAAVILGIIALKKAQSKGMSITGLITGGLAVIASGIFIIVTVMFVGAIAASGDQAVKDLEQLSEELESSATPDITEVPSDSTDSGTDSGTDSASGDRSPEFCTALDSVISASESTSASATEIPAELLDAYGELSAVSSPNQAIYQEFYDFMKDPVAAAGDENFADSFEGFTTAVMEDTMACL